MTTKSTKTSKAVVTSTSSNDVENFAPSLENEIRFVRCNYASAVDDVIFTPGNASGKYFQMKPQDYRSMFNAIREFVAKITLPGGENIHLHNADRSKYDGMRMFYLGGNIAYQAITDGVKSINVVVDNKTIVVDLPKTTDLIGEWVRVMMRTDYTGQVWKATDEKHKMYMNLKHMVLEKLFHGTRVAVWTEPHVEFGEMTQEASKAALLLESDLLNDNGEFKDADAIIEPMYERKNKYQDTNKLAKKTARLEKVASVIGLKVADTIIVDGVETDVNQVQSGWYSGVDGNGVVKFRRINHVHNATSTNNLRTLATEKYALVSEKNI